MLETRNLHGARDLKFAQCLGLEICTVLVNRVEDLKSLQHHLTVGGGHAELSARTGRREQGRGATV